MAIVLQVRREVTHAEAFRRRASRLASFFHSTVLLSALISAIMSSTLVRANSEM
jgi:hypothetical protein